MPERTLKGQSILVAFLLGVSLWTLSSTPAVAGTDGGAALEGGPASLREVPGDPPGIAARPVPGAPRAESIIFDRFVHCQVNVDSSGANIPGDAANEPSIAVDPLDPSKMAIGWRQFDTISSSWREAGWAYSHDYGYTWTFPGALEEGAFRSDPVLSFDSAGNFYYASLAWVGNYPAGYEGVDVFRSTDHGASWLLHGHTGAGDKEWMTIDRSGGMGDGHMYVNWSMFTSCCAESTFTRSVDSGQSFEPPVPGLPGNPGAGSMDVGPDGTLYLAAPDSLNPTTSDPFYVSRSANAQDPGATPTFETVTVDMGGTMRFFLNGSPNPGGLLGQAWICVDQSDGPSRGNVYLLCSVDPPGVDPMDVHFVRSTDGGETWSAPVRVNDDPVGNQAWQWFGTMSVGPNGRIDAVWNDTRNAPAGASYLHELFYSYSTDCGVTWSVNEQASPQWNSYVGFPNQYKIGDYYHMISADWGAQLAWAATFNGEQDVYYVRIVCRDGSAAGGRAPGYEAVAFRLDQNTPNPFNAATSIPFALAVDVDRVLVRVFDSQGRLVTTLFDGPVRAGRRSLAWDGRDSQGRPVPSAPYFYRLEGEGFVQTRTMLLVK